MYTTEEQIKNALREATAALVQAKKDQDKQAAQIAQLTSERDIFIADAERWRELAYKIANSREAA